MTPSNKIKKLKELHVGVKCNDQKVRCRECRQIFPCATAALVDE